MKIEVKLTPKQAQAVLGQLWDAAYYFENFILAGSNLKGDAQKVKKKEQLARVFEAAALRGIKK